VAPGEKRGTQPRRVSGPAGAIAVALGIVAIGGLLAALLSGGSDEGSGSDLAADVEIPTVTVAEVPAATPEASKAPKEVRAAQAAAAKIQADAAASEVVESQSTESACPQAASPAECAALRRHLKRSRQGSTVVEEGGPVCPPSASKAECQELEQALAKSKRESKVLGENECAVPGGYVPCDQAKQQREAGGG
jgi:hypothetical protein